MPKSTSRPRATAAGGPGVPAESCPFCVRTPATMSAGGGQARHRHYLALAHREGLDALEAHLGAWLGAWCSGNPARAGAYAQGVLSWVRDHVALATTLEPPPQPTLPGMPAHV